MADNPKKKKADGKRVALKQTHEREYMERVLGRVQMYLRFAATDLLGARERLRAGYPKTKRKR